MFNIPTRQTDTNFMPDENKTYFGHPSERKTVTMSKSNWTYGAISASDIAHHTERNGNEFS